MQETFTCPSGGNPAIFINRFDTETDADFLTINFGATQFIRTYTLYGTVFLRNKIYFFLSIVTSLEKRVQLYPDN